MIVAVSVLAGLELGRRRFRRLGLEPSIGEGAAWYTVVAGFVGAHLFSVLFYFPREVVDRPLILCRLWEDISSFGGIIGGLIGIWLFLRFKALGLTASVRLIYLDAIAFVFPFALAIGRIACSLAHDHPGTVTSFPLAISLKSPEAHAYIVGVYRAAGRLAELPPTSILTRLGFHDLGWYEFLYLGLVVVPVFTLLDRRPRPAGFFVVMFCSSTCRFASGSTSRGWRTLATRASRSAQLPLGIHPGHLERTPQLAAAKRREHRKVRAVGASCGGDERSGDLNRPCASSARRGHLGARRPSVPA